MTCLVLFTLVCGAVLLCNTVHNLFWQVFYVMILAFVSYIFGKHSREEEDFSCYGNQPD